jgi:hypothetical protein
MQNPEARTEVRTPWSSDLTAVGATVICAMVLWTSTRLADLELAVEQGGDAIAIGGWAVALTAGVSALVGLAVLRLLEQATPRALAIWTALAVVVTLLSLVGPLAATTAAARGTLISLHTVVAAVVIASAHASRRRRSAL